MDDAIHALLQSGAVSPHEAFMKAIDKNRFKQFLPPDEAALGNSAGAMPDDAKRAPGDFVKKREGRA
jgi:twitching motility protein PilT